MLLCCVVSFASDVQQLIYHHVYLNVAGIKRIRYIDLVNLVSTDSQFAF